MVMVLVASGSLMHFYSTSPADINMAMDVALFRLSTALHLSDMKHTTHKDMNANTSSYTSLISYFVASECHLNAMRGLPEINHLPLWSVFSFSASATVVCSELE